MKKSYLKPILIGFLSVYFICMILLTYIVQRYYESHFNESKFQLLDEMAMNLKNSELSAMDGAELNKELQTEMSFKMNHILDDNIEEYVQYSAAVYGPSGKLFAKTDSEGSQAIPESKKLRLSLAEYNEYYSDGPKEVPTTTAFSMNADIAASSMESDMFTLQIFQEGHPWKAAFSSLIHIYFYGLILVIVCVVKSYQVTRTVYKKQQLIEEKKSRATQTIAAKFHDPINDIRGHITNIQTECYEHKEGELERIIEKTEEMDGMIKELIKIAKDEN